jgi:hypothetical protein
MQILDTSQHNFETKADGSSWAPVQYTQQARGPEKIKKNKVSTSKAARRITYNMNFYIPPTTKINKSSVVLEVIRMN